MLWRTGPCASRYRSSRLIYGRGRYGHHGDIRPPVSETTVPKPGATIMATLGHTQTTGVNAKRVTMIGRREFIAGLGGAAAAWPLAARAQQRALPLVGFLSDGSFELRREAVSAFHRGLAERGYVDGR